jgi:hypothetical protein
VNLTKKQRVRSLRLAHSVMFSKSIYPSVKCDASQHDFNLKDNIFLLCKHGDDQIQKFHGQDRRVADLFTVVKRQPL